jgi:hypothetical protein
MMEKAIGFNEYVKSMGSRAARGSSSAISRTRTRRSSRTCPENAEDERALRSTDDLGALVRVDSSLIGRVSANDPDALAAKIDKREEKKADVTTNRRAFVAMIRNAFHRLVARSRAGAGRTAGDDRAPEGEAPWTPIASRPRWRHVLRGAWPDPTDPAAACGTR